MEKTSSESDINGITAHKSESSYQNVIENLRIQRRNRIIVMSLLLLTLIMTVIYGTLENPFKYTLSNIGNFFTYREFFIFWAIITGVSIQTSCVALFKLEDFRHKHSYTLIIYASIFLVLTAIIPALKEKFPFWHFVHILTSINYALFLILGLQPFFRYINKKNPRLRKIIAIWQYVIIGGSFLAVIIFGMSGIFELWFIASITLFLLYLSLILYEENIIKKNVELLRNEKDLNEGIEKIFMPKNPNKKKK